MSNIEITLDKIVTAASSGDLESLGTMFENSEVLFKELINNSGGSGITPLSAALTNKKPDAVEFLLSKKADKNIRIDGKTAVSWAKEQTDNDAACFLLAWDYIDRLFDARTMWEKHKLKEAYCDVCFARITQEESLMLTIDEAFESSEYSGQIIKQTLQYQSRGLETKTREELLTLIAEEVKKASLTGRYFICEDCIEKYFAEIVFGKNPARVFQFVESMYEDV